jgi:serine/threonine-protein kinase
MLMVNAEPNESLPTLTTFGRYKLITKLGSGGMANVYAAVMRGRGDFRMLVVLKIPHDFVARDPELLPMFVDEARLAARLNHKNVVQTYEVVDEGAHTVLVMEYLDGYTLGEVVRQASRKGRAFPLAMHLTVLSEVLTGLQYAHELADFDGCPLELVHRDVSPQNIFIGFDGSIKLLDFGVAQASTSLHVTASGTFKGKIRYMPFEQFRGLDVDRRADIFAVGGVLWEAAAGRRMWSASSDAEIITALTDGKIPAPRDVNAKVSAELDRIVRRALAPDPKDRYPTALAMQADIDAFVETLTERSSAKQVGAYVSELFEEERARRTRAIEANLAAAVASESRGLTSDFTDSSMHPPSSLSPASFATVPPVQRRSRGWGSAAFAGMALTVAVGLKLLAVDPRWQPAAASAASPPPPATPLPATPPLVRTVEPPGVVVPLPDAPPKQEGTPAPVVAPRPRYVAPVVTRQVVAPVPPPVVAARPRASLTDSAIDDRK